jgi:hypothetical protein
MILKKKERKKEGKKEGKKERTKIKENKKFKTRIEKLKFSLHHEIYNPSLTKKK